MRSKKMVVWAVILVAITAGLVWYYVAGQIVAVDISSVAKGEIISYIEDTATVKCRNTQTIFAEGSGKIIEIKADAGDAVKSGDLLAVLDKTSLELQLEDAKAKISAAQAQLKGTELANYANRIELAKASVEQAAIVYDSALRTYNSVKQLYDGDSSSKDDLDRAQDACKVAESALEAARSELDEVKRGASESVKKGYEAVLEQAIIYKDMISDNLKKQEIRAAIDGVILEKLVEDNSYLSPGTPVFTMGDNQLLELEADILADDAVALRVGNAVEASGKAIPDGTAKGKVAKIAPAAKTVVSALGVNQKRVPVTISFEGDTSFLKPGYDLDIKIITGSKDNIIVVPDSAIFEQNGSSSIFVVENGKTVIRNITKGIEGKDLIEVPEGISEGEKILAKPDNSVREGMKVNGR